MLERISDRGRSMLIELEGSRSEAYKDSAGLLTIGVGHFLTKDELSSGKITIDALFDQDREPIHRERVRWRNELTDEQIERLLTQDLAIYETAVSEGVDPILSQPQFDALVSFTFNVGAHAFTESTLLRLLNGGRPVEVPSELRKWIYAGGVTVDGLVRRREKEIQLWNEA